ncbi:MULTISPECIES: hypothetical protein [unclassified Bradyrhizobium]|uniref:hypothetical protein n=1 Tax=unclassified Bradyrhizobium TaxID=2631580 RepID=UPI00188D05EA|nr:MULTISPECIES: hypothetical protein [unclassified Bradyrhizobium]MDN4983835.1 hypothetical protein [Bradyrhizobium sp. WYCCWR 13022]
MERLRGFLSIENDPKRVLGMGETDDPSGPAVQTSAVLSKGLDPEATADRKVRQQCVVLIHGDQLFIERLAVRIIASTYKLRFSAICAQSSRSSSDMPGGASPSLK